MIKESLLITKQAIAIGIGLFLILSTVGYIVFPVIFQGQIDAISHQLEEHTGIEQHAKQVNTIKLMQNRLTTVEAALLRIDPGFRIIPPIAVPDTLAADSLK